MIDGVTIMPLKRIADDRGAVMHMMRRDWAVFDGFGEIYFSSIYHNVVKAWHFHERMTINYAVPIGTINIVLFDDREGSPTRGRIQEIAIGEDDYRLVSVPPLIWNGFVGLGEPVSLVANCANIPHDENEIRRRDPNDPAIPYDWTNRDP